MAPAGAQKLGAAAREAPATSRTRAEAMDGRSEPSARPGASQELQRVVAEFARADADQAVERVGPDLAVADLAGAGGEGDDVGDLVGVARVAHDLDLDLGQEVDRVLRSAVGLGLAALAAEALD